VRADASQVIVLSTSTNPGANSISTIAGL
jgi:hypothetical protein